MPEGRSILELESEIERLRVQLDQAQRDLQRDQSAALLASEELNRRIIEAMPAGIVHVSIEGAILTANAEASRILGLSYDALSKRYTRDFETETVWEDGTPCPMADYPVTRALLTGQAQAPVVIGVRRPDGTIAWAIFTAVPVLEPKAARVAGAVVTFLDITERKSVETSLRSSEGLFRSIMESAPNPMVSADRQGRVVFANHLPPSVPREQLIGQPIWTPLSPDEQDRVKSCHERVVATGQLETLHVVGPAGRRWWARAAPRYDGGQIVGVTYVAWDVTKEKEMEARLAVTDRLASIGTLAAGVAHELNNPLTYLLGNLESIAAHGATRADAGLRECCEGALEGAERIRRVVADLGSYSRLGEGPTGLSDARELLDAALRLANNTIRFRAEVKRHYPEHPVWVADDGRVAQVFLNLIVNAAQALREDSIAGNRIEVKLGVLGPDRTVVEVTDTGEGIAPEAIDRVFDPFYTTKANHSGTGLGLFICRSVVTSLGGEIGVQSRLGEGSSFRVVLPSEVPGRGDRPVTRAGSVAEAPEPGLLRLLVVDDERAILDVMRLLLRPHEVVAVRSGSEATERLCREDFDLGFCDLIMPEIGGMEVYEAVKLRRPGFERRLVFMTGGAFTERAQRFLESVPNPVLRKPFSREELNALIRSRVVELRDLGKA